MTKECSIKGFTLIEILAALAILGTAIFALLDAHYASLSLHVTTDEEVTYRELVETTAARAETLVLQGTLSESGDFGQRYPDFTWSFDAEIESPSGEDGSSRLDPNIGADMVPLYRVHVVVNGPGEEKRELEFYTFNTGLPIDEDGTMFRNTRPRR